MNKLKKYLKEAVIFFIFITIFANGVSLYKSLDLSKQPLSLTDVTLISDVNFALPKEKPILIHFWATWCPACKIEAPNIQTISEHYDVLTIAVKSGSDADIKEYLEKRDLNFRVINDKDGLMSTQFGVSVFPTTIVYDKNRDVLFSDVGYTSTWGLWLRMWWSGL